jgi:iron-only hydrogenase group A
MSADTPVGVGAGSEPRLEPVPAPRSRRSDAIWPPVKNGEAMVSLTIDGLPVQVPAGTTILAAARQAGIHIPTLCTHDELDHRPATCRICLVETSSSRNLVASCVAPVAEGLRVRTSTERVRRQRRAVVELLLSDHPADCTSCRRNGTCELQAVAQQVGAGPLRLQRTVFAGDVRDTSSPALVRDPSRCIDCLRCVTVCAEVQSVHLLTPEGRGFNSRIVPALHQNLADTACTYCGQCAVVCPTGALVERDDTERVWAALEDPQKVVVVQEAPAIRATLGEECGLACGSLVTPQMIAVLRRLGFDRVFDTNFTADLTIVEEGHELLQRLQNGGTLPMLTSCCPGWVKFLEHFYPEHLHHLSTCKSPQQMFGALAKTYYAQYAGVDPEDIFVVSIMPCTAKKFEATRPEMCSSGCRDVDAVLTTRELGRMIRQAGIDFATLPAADFDPPMGLYSGAGTIFGATGGVMEAALRSVYALVVGEPLARLEITPLRGLVGIKEASLTIGELGGVRVAVAHGLAHARQLMDEVVAGRSPYHFIEVMACPGGCVGGGGQSLPASNQKREQRAGALHRDDHDIQGIRQSHENPAIRELYKKFLREPLGELSHQLVHTHYTPRGL